MKAIYTDIDGVGNAHEHCHLGSDTGAYINPFPAKILNRIIRKSNPDVVILISAWRWKIIDGLLSVEGFRYLLQTHGIHINCRFDYLTDRYGNDAQERAAAVARHVAANGWDRWCVIDDFDLQLPNHVRPNPDVGLRPYHCSEALKFMGA